LQQAFLPSCESRGIREAGELGYRTLNQLTPDLVEVAGRRGKLSRCVVDTYLRNINLFLGWRRENESDDVRAQRPKLPRRVLAVAEVAANILEHARPPGGVSGSSSSCRAGPIAWRPASGTRGSRSPGASLPAAWAPTTFPSGPRHRDRPGRARRARLRDRGRLQPVAPRKAATSGVHNLT
jgi:hypothetical protein